MITKIGTLVLVIAIVAFMATQVIIPAFTSTKFFPAFRGTGADRLRNAAGAINEARLSHEAAKIERAAETLKKKTEKISPKGGESSE